MHILYVTRNYDERSQGGRNPSLRYYARAMRERGHEVSIVSTPFHPANSARTIDGVPYTPYSERLSYDGNLPMAIPRLFRAGLGVDRHRRVDVIHSLYREFAGVASVFLKWRLRRPMVQWMYDLGFTSQEFVLSQTRAPGPLSPFLRQYLKWGERFVLFHSDRILAIGQDIIEKSLHPRGYSAPQVVLLENTVDPERFRPRAPPLTREALGLPPGRLVLMISRIDPVKGIDAFLETAGRLAVLRPDVSFVVVGRDKDGLLPRYRGRCQRLGIADRITWLDSRDDVEVFYAHAEIVMICTLDVGGGISNVLLEAMSSGCAVVANRACGVPYVIRDGDNGVSVENNDPVGYAAALGSLLDDRKKLDQIRHRARETVESTYSIGASADRLEEVYSGLVQPRRAPGRRNRGGSDRSHP